jgi:hypothetical protein
LAILLILASAPLASASEDTADLGIWWQKSPRAYDPIPDKMLHHFQGTYSLVRGEGNVNSKIQNGDINLILRKNIVTSRTGYNATKSEVTLSTYPNNTILTERSNIDQRIITSITRKLNFVLGYWYDKNDNSYMERNDYYGGFHLYLFHTPSLSADTGLYYGRSNESYMNNALKKIGIISKDLDDYKSNSVFFTQDMRWSITDNISFSDSIFSGYMLKKDADYDDSKYYFAEIKFSLALKLTKFVSVTTSYSINYDDNRLFEAKQTALGSIHRKDTSLYSGITLTF